MDIATWYYPKTWPRDDWDGDLDAAPSRLSVST